MADNVVGAHKSANLPNYFPANISGYMVVACEHPLKCFHAMVILFCTDAQEHIPSPSTTHTHTHKVLHATIDQFTFSNYVLPYIVNSRIGTLTGRILLPYMNVAR